jgi:hypothetical protein
MLKLASLKQELAQVEQNLARYEKYKYNKLNYKII